MVHRLHIEDEGHEGGNLGAAKHSVRPYCECGWLGRKVSAYDNVERLAREKFYDHLRNLNQGGVPA